MNLSFAGCGFLGIYHVGVAVCFKKYAPHLLLDKISGASVGAIAACCLLCDLPLGEITSNVLRVAREARQRTLGPFSPSFNVQEILLESLQKFLPNDAHIRVSGKLHVSLTRVYDGKNVIVSQFSSREDLLQALLASAFVPIFSGLLPPRFHGIRYMDGGFSDNLPTLDENTITISPFCGESDICPRDVSSQLFHVNLANTSIELSRQNIYRFARILFPPNTEILSNMCKQGFDDALRFLHRNNLLNCTRCLAVQSTFVVSETLDDNMDYDPECLECKMHRQEALVSNLPETVMTIFQDAIDSANKGLINWLFKHRSVKLLSLLSLPCTLPADVVYATFTNLIGNKIESHTLEYNIIGNILHTPPQMISCAKHMTPSRFILNVPKLQRNLLELKKFFLNQLNILFPKINVYYQQMPQTIKCQLAITEYGSNIYDMEATEKTDNLYKNKKNLNLTLQYNELQPWKDHINTSNCVINMSNLSTDDTFENILQVTSDQEAVMAYYYMDDNNKVQVTEIFDVTDSESHAMLSIEEVENNTKLQFDEWDEHTWLSQHTFNDVATESDANQQSVENLSEISLEDDILGILNTSSDPESEWEISKELQTIKISKSSNTRLEVD
ncbi:1-acylglycerol-3-phosphate O-acyltransferase Pnpla3 isoform X1 [Apis mellifera caucasica]|uniref:triacylglycerol lipase n=1 Tax=Apis mellifera TaxID=7460 RepID=A0A7M7L3G9_APIME|nr:1-acylglycerol-3-phosphate O-acyltransferase Pnpla3 isoform X1 [Apis mellifera]KAG6797001.1 1-acylglycerol-3-phosphate O-acyltransferase Pnpla3 isoform X1 [Apis mellifera caucasica]KAG9436703.1 1-acylglycerol-3-phosphate O-acyltransferase Pnpla3 isoform X1 [Apis mellifera carnica]|eukprot:XP_026297019.1 1-acylglycerol-3-phosphate O-acyltransferase Pnpla3 isoform X1 [Apis mellifera]